ncbi:hypothetical protein GCM10008968_35260 [Bacillus horti]
MNKKMTFVEKTAKTKENLPLIVKKYVNFYDKVKDSYFIITYTVLNTNDPIP